MVFFQVKHVAWIMAQVACTVLSVDTVDFESVQASFYAGHLQQSPGGQYEDLLAYHPTTPDLQDEDLLAYHPTTLDL